MTSKAPLKLAAAFALTVGIGYSLCTLAFWLSPAAASGFMTALFHGLDFSPLAKQGAFTIGSFVFALAVLMAWAFAFAACFGLLLERFAGPGRAAGGTKPRRPLRPVNPGGRTGATVGS